MAYAIFLSYRRDDSAATVGRIYDRLVAQFGKDAVFKDVYSIEPSVDFVAAIEAAIDASSLVIAIMGTRWRGTDVQTGRTRLENSDDFVRMELETALRRRLRVIPVLVDGAKMPSVASLPDSLREFEYCNALPVRGDPDFQRDMDQLVRACRKLDRRPKAIHWFIVAALALVAVSAVWLARRRPESPPVPPPALTSDVTATVEWGERQMSEDDIPPERTVTYSSRLENGVSFVTYGAEYVELARGKGPVMGINYLGTPFKWRFPYLSVKVVNNSDKTLLLSRVLLDVQSSEIDDRPIISFEDLSVNKIAIRNEGWGPVVAPHVTFTVDEVRNADEVPLFAPPVNTVDLASFEAKTEIPITEFVPKRLLKNGIVAVEGTIEHGADGARHQLRFSTRVSLQVRTAVGLPPSHTYQTLLTAGLAPVTEQVSIEQQLGAGEADHFLIRLGTTKSCTSRMKISLQTVDGTILPCGEMVISLFVPRTAGQIRSSNE